MSHLRTFPTRTLSSAALAALAVVLALGGPAIAHEGETEWSQFQGGPGHGGALPDGPEPPFRQAWRFSPPSGALSGAVITGGVAVAVGTQAVYALDLSTGSQAWQIARDGGPLSMPAVGSVGERAVLVYLEGPAGRVPNPSAGPSGSASPTPSSSASPTASGAAAEASTLVAVDLADRRELWRTQLEGVSRSGVSIDGDHAFVADDDGKAYAVNLGSGAITWTAEAIGRVESPPAVAGGFVDIVARNPDAQQAQVLALDERTGEKAWDYRSRQGATLASAASATDGMVVFGAGDRFVRALDATSGTVRWQALTQTPFSQVTGPAFQPGNVYVADYSGGVYRIDPTDGAKDWQFQTNQYVLRSSPVVSGGAILLGLNGGRLVAFDAETGDLIWQSPPSQGLVGTIALSHEVIVAVKGGKQAGLIAFEHDPSGELVRVPSPTSVDPARLFGNFAIALVLASAVLLLPFLFLRSRMAPPFAEGAAGQEMDDLDEEDWGADEEPEGEDR